MTDELKNKPAEVAEKTEQKPKAGSVKTVKTAQVVKNVPRGRAYVHATYNNTIVTLTDTNGNVIGWSSAGKMGFKGPKKATPYAAAIITQDAVTKAKVHGLREVNVFLRGVGAGREAAIRALNTNGILVSSIKDITPIPHNGPRLPKPRRI